MKTLKNLLFLSLFCALGSCSQDLVRNFRPSAGIPHSELGLRRVSPGEVIIKQISPKEIKGEEASSRFIESRKKSGLGYLGVSHMVREQYFSNQEIAKVASKIGSNVVYAMQMEGGKRERTVDVTIAKTPDTTIRSNTNVYGSSGNYAGRLSNTTTIPGSTTYGTRTVEYDVRIVTVLFFVSEDRFSPEGRAKVYANRKAAAKY